MNPQPKKPTEAIKPTKAFSIEPKGGLYVSTNQTPTQGKGSNTNHYPIKGNNRSYLND